MDDNFPTKVILRQKPKICLLPFVTTPLVIVFCCLYVVAHRRRRWQLWCVTQLWRQCPVHLWPWSSVVRLSVQPRICRYTCISCSAYAHRQASLFFVQSYNQQYDVGPINQEVKTRNMGGGVQDGLGQTGIDWYSVHVTNDGSIRVRYAALVMMLTMISAVDTTSFH